jgi:hypothetical protein
VVQVVHGSTWEGGLHQEQVGVSTLVLMVTGQETARLEIGRTNATVVEKGAI